MARVVIVTGGLGVLGQAVVSAFPAQDYRVACIDSVAAGGALPGALVIDSLDCADARHAETAIGQVETELGDIYALVNCAGTFAWETVEQGTLDTWERLFHINLMTALSMSRAVLPGMRARGAGRIVNIGAASAIHSGAGMGAYAASKSAIHRLTESLALELRGTRITVNAVLPAIIDTPANRADMPEADPADWTSPRAIADVIAFLAGDGARAVTGALVPVTGEN